MTLTLKSAAQLRQIFLDLLDQSPRRLLHWFTFSSESRMQEKILREYLSTNTDHLTGLESLRNTYHFIITHLETRTRLVHRFLQRIADELGVEKHGRHNPGLGSFAYAVAGARVLQESVYVKIEKRL